MTERPTTRAAHPSAGHRSPESSPRRPLSIHDMTDVRTDRPSPRNDRPSPRSERPSPRSERVSAQMEHHVESPVQVEHYASAQPSPGHVSSPRHEEPPSPRHIERASPRASPNNSPRHDTRPSPQQSPRHSASPAHSPRHDRGGGATPGDEGGFTVIPKGSHYLEKSPRSGGFKAESPRAGGHSGDGIVSSPRNRGGGDVIDFNSLPTMGGQTGLSPRMSSPRASAGSTEVLQADHGDEEYLMFGVKHMQLKKDAHKYKEPHLLISVVNKKGQLVEAVQRTPDATVEGQTLIFDYVVSLETTRNQLVALGGAIFFELRHWKCSHLTVGEFDLVETEQEEGRHSVKAYVYINGTEVQHMACRLPIFKSGKPTDFKRLWHPVPLSQTHKLFMHMDMIIGPRRTLEANWGFVYPRPLLNSGATITFLIVSIGLKDADSRDLGEGTGYVNPRMKLTVIDGKGNRIDRSYSTAEHGTTKERQAILFDQELTIPLHLEDLYNLDAYIYFEFVHFKAHKARDSVKCYSFMSVRKMRNGCLKLPIFKSEKPTDMMRGFLAKPNSIKDLWFRTEIFCESFNDLPPVDYSNPRARAESAASDAGHGEHF